MTLNNTQSNDKTPAEKRQASYDRTADVLTCPGETDIFAGIRGATYEPHDTLICTIGEEFIDRLHDRHGDDIPAKYTGEGISKFPLITLNIRDGHIKGVEIPSAVPEKTLADVLLSVCKNDTLTSNRHGEGEIDVSDATHRLLIHAAEEMDGPGAQLLAEELTDDQTAN